MTFTKL